MRYIPATIATQHPDNARECYFTGERFISARDEIEECYRCYAELGIGEYMWDWEGKFVDEAVIDRLYNQHHDFFKETQLGREVFLTFRVPNIWVEESSSHKLPRAFMNMVTAEKAAKTYGFHAPPLFEIIQPMTSSGDQLIYLQKKFKEIAAASEDIFELKSDMKMVEIIPLFEEFSVIANVKTILQEYVDFLKKEYDYKPEYMRVFTARSDPALNAGLIPAKLASKLSIALYHEFGEANGIEMYPWIGAGSLPFRGGLNPANIEPAIDTYRGMATVTVQSAFRYDYPMEDVKKSIALLNEKLPANRKDYDRISDEEKEQLFEFSAKVAGFWRETIEAVADTINQVAAKMPGHRERVQHIGLFGYSRGIGEVKLPRAIKFTGSMYSLGVPPELIGTGRAFKLAQEMGILDLVKRLCPHLYEDFVHAGHYLNRENLDLLCEENSAWEVVRDEIPVIEETLGLKIGPDKTHHILHRNFTSNIFHRLKMGQDFSEDVLKAAEIRKSLG